MTDLPPYIPSAGTIGTVLDKIIVAQAPDKFDKKFLAEKLNLKGGGPATFIPYAKRIGLLNPDGSPTDLYKRFRAEGKPSTAIAQTLRKGYASIFERNEAAHTLTPEQLKSLVIEMTGKERDSTVVKTIVACFLKLREYASFAALPPNNGKEKELPEEEESDTLRSVRPYSFAYTINLNLPESTNPAVFTAIFRALRDHLLVEDK